MEIGNIIGSAATGVGLVKFCIFVNMLYLNMIAKLVFFSSSVWQKNCWGPKTFIEYLMIFNVKPVNHIHDRLHFQVLDPKC